VKIKAKVAEAKSELKPRHKCFCCLDSGRVSSNLINNYVEGEVTIPFICRRESCEAGAMMLKAYMMSDSDRLKAVSKDGVQFADYIPQAEYQSMFDIRLTKYECEGIHQQELAMWQQTKPVNINLPIKEMPKCKQSQ
jgi:hypothetical protein